MNYDYKKTKDVLFKRFVKKTNMATINFHSTSD